MSHEHFIIIRFNLKVTRRQWKQPIKKWDFNRLNHRFFLFENICLPSLIKQQHLDNYQVILLVSHDFPKKYKNRLLDNIKKYKFIHIEYVKDELFHNRIDFLKKYIKVDTKIIATTRFDDDDALNPIFTKLVFKYIKQVESNDYFITFTSGHWLNLDRRNKKITYLPCNKKFIACGLTRVTNIEKSDNKNTIYCGNHNGIGKLGIKVIINKRAGLYSVTNHDFNDSNNRLRTFSIRKNNKNLDKLYMTRFNFINTNKLLNGEIIDISKN